MNRHIKRIFIISAIFSLLATNIYGTSTIFANSDIVSDEIQFTPEQNKLIKEGLTSENIAIIEQKLSGIETPSVRYETRSVQTKAVKAAIKAVLANKNRLIRTVGKYVGADAAASVGSAFNVITPVFNRLLKYQSLAYGTVEGQVSSALISAGFKSSTARSIAYWVRLGLEWLV
ncbi:hypothetical protein ACQTPQ_08680 [Streptococcus hyovaginalis]|uniref:Uncharacterized protein n=1 Tax=Streptococcus suis TaxID=1307 RepID=A0ACD4UI96_STRSU